MRRASAATMLTVLVATLAACGAGEPDGERRRPPTSDPARSTVESYFRAVDRADGRAICALFTRRLRRGVERLQSAPCERALAQEARRLPENLNAYRVLAVRKAGPTATVSLDGGGFRDEIQLERARRGWLIASAPGLGQ